MHPPAPAGQCFCKKEDMKSSRFICLVSNELHGAVVDLVWIKQGHRVLFYFVARFRGGKSEVEEVGSKPGRHRPKRAPSFWLLNSDSCLLSSCSISSASESSRYSSPARYSHRPAPPGTSARLPPGNPLPSDPISQGPCWSAPAPCRESRRSVGLVAHCPPGMPSRPLSSKYR